ncbi:hypothetical protein NOS3756_53860 [Nostoc sp. NIES-3756]|uniref:hypothetical protein n=1 Tax=Nostoc sp. NIES-3756 TaxID=1751286 RepID=UPI000720E122|nr:hypothetical protein [Nostoc sp. NIES-3756]BAT56381.1 hypothetical protein NOS3756_53860 [Nostoc sp. NIES-3756]
MSLYCQVGDKPKVIFRKNGDIQDNTYYSPSSPINVTVTPLDNPNLNGETYAWNFSTNLNPRTTLEQLPFRAIGKLTDFRVTGVISTDTVNGQQVANYGAEFRDGNGNLITGSAVGYLGDTPKLAKILLPNTNKPPEQICKLEVKDTSQNILFSASGKCPINYQVACGNCPDGYIECKTDSYPGYCCIPCSELRNGIAAATSALRGINRG